jgi:chromosome segregation protein
MEKHLKSIELQGYKTFASKTVFEFDSAITAIVGPNGSGKSNIADAVRWVLGEQSYSLLRGRKTADMIFSGSEERSRAGMAAATILFNNESGWLPIDFSEVSITRRAYRDGMNEYLINGQRVRLRDVTELLGNSGLSERTYTIIGQGLVDVALSLKAEERRRLFEEAAGIGLYRSRREEAQKRLEKTKRNLERVEDILSELKPRLRSLERQSERTRRQQQIQSDLHDVLREWYGYHWYRAQRDLQKAQNEDRRLTSKLEFVRGHHEGIEKHTLELQEKIKNIRSQLQLWNQESTGLNKKREIISRDLAVTEERISALKKNKSDIENELERTVVQLDSQRERLAEAKSECEQYEQELSQAKSTAGDTKEELESRQVELGMVESKLISMQDQLDHLHERRNHLKGQLSECERQIDRHDSSLQSNDRAIEKNHKDLLNLDEKLKVLKRLKEDATNARRVADDIYNKHHEQEEALRKEREERLHSLAVQEKELARLDAELKVLIEAKKDLLDYKHGAQVILGAVNIEKLQGENELLGNMISVSDKYQKAIFAAFGDYVDAVILHDKANSEYYLDILSENEANAVLLPLYALQYDPINSLHLDEKMGVIGIASNLVKITPEYQPVIELLLGQVVIVKDRKTAQRVLVDENLQQYKLLRVVTLKGEIFHLSGPVIANYDLKSPVLNLNRNREIEDQIIHLERNIAELKESIKDLNDKLVVFYREMDEHLQASHDARQEELEAVENYSQAVLERDQAEQQIHWYRKQQEQLDGQIKQEKENAAQLSEGLDQLDLNIQEILAQKQNLQSKIERLKLDETVSESYYWSTQTAVIEQALESSRRYKQERQETVDMLSLRKESLEKQLAEIALTLTDKESFRDELRSSETELVGQIDLLREKIIPNEEALSKYENNLFDLQTEETKARKQLNEVERMYSQARIMLTRRKEELRNLRERIEHDFGLVEFEYAEDISGPTPLPWEGLVERLPFVSMLPEGLDDTLKRLRGQLRRIGPVNPDAQNEYQEVKSRYEFITEQIVDLTEAEKDVQAVIRELDEIMEREFCSTFEKVSKEFREIFTRLFGGGSANLVLIDPDDVMLTGIDIEARLPGRRTHGLSLLSGGERSLTATALIFSLMKVSPTPFCILDEVDAMLDEANIGRFRDILQELSENSQFIIITHNRNTVQAADIIYGVTMGRDSTSQMISLKMDQVKEIV